MPTVIVISGVIESRWKAIKFTPERGSISVRAETDDTEVRVTVADTGPGIPSDQLANIFVAIGKHAGATGRIAWGCSSPRHCPRPTAAESGPKPIGSGATFIFVLPRAA